VGAVIGAWHGIVIGGALGGAAGAAYGAYKNYTAVPKVPKR
jgi:hypothetical protein